MPLRALPEPDAINRWLASLHDGPLSYHHAGGVEEPPERGFVSDHHRCMLGVGEQVYQRACAALDTWMMFPYWTTVYPLGTPQEPGQIVAMTTRIFGLWWINPARILCRCDSPSGKVLRHGFVYGTLPQHAECGEERFMVEMLPDGSVWYDLRAFSKPQHVLAWIGFPFARWWQLKFVRDSQSAMKKAVLEQSNTEAA